MTDTVKDILGLELKLKNFKEDRDSMEKEIKYIGNDIQSINSQVGVIGIPPHLKNRRKNLIERKKQIEKDLKVVRESINKHEKAIRKVKDKRYPIKHPNMPYIESALAIASNDEENSKSDGEEEKIIEQRNLESDDGFNSFVPHPNVNLKRDSEYLKRMQNKSNFVPHPNVNLGRSREFRDWQSEKIQIKNSANEFEAETISMPVTKQEKENKNIKCTCNHDIDPEILANCTSFGDCTICQKAMKKINFKPSKISFASDLNVNKCFGHKGVNLTDCKSFENCKMCRELFQDAPHLPICKSFSSCKECERFKNQIRKKFIEDESDERMSIKSSSFADSCMSLDQCKECQIAREVKKFKFKKSTAKNLTHKNCFSDFCIPYFVKKCDVSCANPRPTTQPRVQHSNLSSTSKKHKRINSDNFSVHSGSIKSHDCSSCHKFDEKLLRPKSHHQVYSAILHGEHMTRNSELSLASNLSKTIAYCQNCSSFAPVLKIPSKLLKQCGKAAESCQSIGTCKKCHQLAKIANQSRHAKNTSDDDEMSDKKPSQISVIDTSTEAAESDENINWKKSSTQYSCKSLCNKCQLQEFIAANGCNSCETCKFCSLLRKSFTGKKKSRSKVYRSNNKVLSNNSSGDQRNSYEQMKKIIEHQNDVISKIQDEIHYSVKKNSSDYVINKLTMSLENAKVKLRSLVQVVISEQRKRRDENWKPIKVSLIDDL